MDIDNLSDDDLEAFLDDVDGIDGDMERLRQLPFDEVLAEARRGTSALPDNEVWRRAMTITDGDGWKARMRQALQSGIPPLRAFRALAERSYPTVGAYTIDMSLNVVREILRAAPRDALEELTESGRAAGSVHIPVWLEGYNLITRARCSLQGWASLLDTFAEEGFTVSTKVLMHNAHDEHDEGPSGLIAHMLAREQGEDGQHLVEAMLDRVLDHGDREQSLNKVMEKIRGVRGQAQHVRLLLNRGLVVNESHILGASPDTLGVLVEQGRINHWVDGARWFSGWRREADRAQRLLTLIQKCEAHDLNATTKNPYPFPLWVSLLAAGRNMELDTTEHESLFQAALSNGCDISRAGIGRHFPDDEKSEEVEFCFSILRRVKVYVEGEELRKVAEEAMAAQAEPEQRHVRRRL